MSRRQFGKVRVLASGRHQARYKGPDGRERAAPRTFETPAEAQQFLALMDGEMASGEWIDPLLGLVPFGDYALNWLTVRTEPLSPRTEELYRQLLRSHISPTWGAVPINQIAPSGVRRWYADLLAEGRSRGVAAKSYRLMRAVLNTAVEDERLRRNPCKLRGAGAEHHVERTPPSLGDLGQLLDASPDRYRLLIELAAWSGLRWGELVVLTRADVDTLHGTVAVTKALIETQAGVSLGPPKSHAGRRAVAIPPHLLPALRTHLVRHVGGSAESLVFVGPRGAQLRRRNFNAIWQQIRTEAGLPEVHFHDLRHLAATLAAMTGATTKELMARMGHSSPRAAMIYQHATASRDVTIAAALSDLATAHNATAVGGGQVVHLPRRE